MSSIRFGLIGYGAWGRLHASAIAKTSGAKLVAITARSADTRSLARSDHPTAKTHEDYRALLERDDLDVIDVVLPSNLHFEVAQAALESGRHLLLEKPMALTLEHCDRLIALAQERGKLLAVGHELRLSSLWSRIKAMIDAGHIGQPRYAFIELWRHAYRQGSEGWRYDVNRVGSWALEQPIHFLDLARWYFAAIGNPIAVCAQANSMPPGHPELQDNFSAMLSFAGGAYALISQTLCGFEHHQVAKVTGTEGALWATWSGATDRTPQPTFSLRHFDGHRVEAIHIDKITGGIFELEDQIATVARAVRDGAALHATGEDGRWAVAMCLAAQQSAATSAVVSLDNGAHQEQPATL